MDTLTAVAGAFLVFLIFCVDVYVGVELLHMIFQSIRKQKRLKTKHTAFVLIGLSVAAGAVYHLCSEFASCIFIVFVVFMLLAPPIRFVLLFTIDKTFSVENKIGYGIALGIASFPLLAILAAITFSIGSWLNT